jgi:hypothetical protein
MPIETEKNLRWMAKGQGYRLMKSRARDPRDPTYGGYQLIDLESGRVSCGEGNGNRRFAADLDDIQEFLTIKSPKIAAIEASYPWKKETP